MPEIADLYTVLRAETAPFTRGMRHAAEEGESLTTRMGGLRQSLVKLGAATTMAGVGFAVYGVKAAGDFQQQMNLLVTACGESSKNLKKVSDGVLGLARSTGTSTSELADGMYQVEKAGYRASDGLTVLKAAAQGAREEGASLKDVTNAMTSVMASYHLKATDSVRVMNALKTAAGEGKMTMEEFSRSLSTVIPIASANKVSFGEVGGAIATLTQHGTSAREATQELANTIRNLAAPNNVAVQEMQRLGLSSTDVSTQLGKRGLTGTLDLLTQTVLGKMGKSGTVLLSTFNQTKQAARDADTMVRSMPPGLQKLAQSYAKGSISLGDWRKTLKTLPPEQANLLGQYATLQNRTNGFNDALKRGGPAAQTYTEAIKKMTGGATGLNTTLQLSGENTAGFKDRVEKVSASFKHASKDVEGWDVTQKSFNVQMGRLKEAVQTTAITVGLKLIPVITKVIDYFEHNRSAALVLAAAVGTVLTTAVLAFAATAVKSAVTSLINFGKGLIAAGRAIKAFVLSEKVAAAAAKVWAVAQAALNAVLEANPLILLAIAVAALVAGLAYAYFHCQRFREIVQSAFAGVLVAAQAVWQSLQAVWAGLVTGVTWLSQRITAVWNAISAATTAVWGAIAGFFRKWWPLLLVIFLPFVALLIATWNHFHQQIIGTAHRVWGAVLGFLKTTWGVIRGVASVVWSGVQTAVIGPMQTAWAVLRAVFQKVSGWLSSTWGGIRDTASAIWGTIESAMTGPLADAWSTITATMGKIKSAVSDGLNQTWTAVSGIGDEFASIGTGIVEGIVSGISGSAGMITDTLKSVAGGALDSAKSFLGINSPSKVFADQVGTSIPEGIALGVANSAHLAHRAITRAAQGTVDSFKATLGIHSPSTVFRQLGIYLNAGLVDGLTGSTARVRAATRRIESLLIQTRNRVQDLLATKAAKGKKGAGLREWVAEHEKTITRLEAYAKREDRALRGLAAKRDAVASKLRAAQSRLSALQAAWRDERSRIASGIMQGSSVVTTAPQPGMRLTAQDVVNSMRDQVNKATQFATQLRKLQKMGLRSDLIEQIAAAGVDQGGATAAALAGAGKGTINELNKLQKNMKSNAERAGAAVADSMYGAGIKSAQGLVKGLRSQEKAIEAQMLRIARAMQKAIKQALGIRSPSAVFAALGQFIPLGLARGIEAGARHATGAVRNLAGAVTGASGLAGAALAGAGGGTVIHQHHYEIHVAGSVATVDGLARDIERAFLRRATRNPTTYAPFRR
jgi:TP901 family phage tail tape measure protein